MPREMLRERAFLLLQKNLLERFAKIAFRHASGKIAFGRAQIAAQIATEYLIITIFLLAIITITFAYSFINYDQNIKITQANNAIDALINKADYVYSLGPENSQFTWITLPIGTQSISITHICTTAGQQPAGQDCPLNDPIKFSAINLTVSLLGGPATISWPSKAKLEIVSDAPPAKPFPCTSDPTFCDGTYKIRVCYGSTGSSVCPCSDGKVCLKKV